MKLGCFSHLCEEARFRTVKFIVLGPIILARSNRGTSAKQDCPLTGCFTLCQPRENRRPNSNRFPRSWVESEARTSIRSECTHNRGNLDRSSRRFCRDAGNKAGRAQRSERRSPTGDIQRAARRPRMKTSNASSNAPLTVSTVVSTRPTPTGSKPPKPKAVNTSVE